MTPHVLVSYDDSTNDRDALELSRAFAELGASLELGYVRHATQARPDREQLAESEAEELLHRGARILEDPSVRRSVVVSGSTSAGLAALAARGDADVIVFGSDYRTPAGHVSVCRSAQALLENGTTAVALAPAGHCHDDLSTVGILPGTADEAAIETAFSIAGRHDARVAASAHGVDLLVVGSRAEAAEGRVMLTSAAAAAIEEATAPVLVVAKDVALRFDTLVTV